MTQHRNPTAYDTTATHSCDASTGDLHLHDVHALSAKDIEIRLQAAERQCMTQGARFTSLRRNVYRLILESDKPLGAYDLIQGLQASRQAREGSDAKMVAPPTIYRTLEFLLQFGFIHQLTSINAFVPCCHPRDKHNAVFLLCNECQRVQECSSLPVQGVVDYIKDTAQFWVEQSVMELRGLCQQCVAKTA